MKDAVDDEPTGEETPEEKKELKRWDEEMWGREMGIVTPSMTKKETTEALGRLPVDHRETIQRILRGSGQAKFTMTKYLLELLIEEAHYTTAVSSSQFLTDLLIDGLRQRGREVFSGYRHKIEKKKGR